MATTSSSTTWPASAAARHRVFEAGRLTKRVDAVLVLSLQPSAVELTRLKALDRPVTFVGADVPGWATVRIDDERTARTAIEHLVGLGHRRIAYVGGPGRARLHRTQRATGGLPLRPSSRPGCRTTRASRSTARSPWPEARTPAGGSSMRPDRPTAIFAASDEMAIGVLRAARELHLRVPEDVSVVGIDDHELAAFFDLTTVAQPVLEQGRLAAQQVLDAIAASTTAAGWHPDQVILPTTLLQRGSTGPPPPA